MTIIPHLIKRIAMVTLIMAGIAGCTSIEPRSEDEEVAATVDPLQQAKAEYNAGNYDLAADILTREARQGDDEALYALGYLYYYGHGIPKDQNHALALFSQAAQQGNKKAIKALTRLSRSLGEQELAKLAREDEESAEPLGEPGLTGIDSLPVHDKEETVAISAGEESDRRVLPSSASGPQENAAGTVGTALLPRDETPLPETTTAVNQPFTLEWLGRQNPDHYTLQLAAGASLDFGVRFIRTHKLENKATVVTTERDEKPWYIIVHGVFPTLPAARQALRGLPPALSQNQPWIRRLGDLF